MGVQELLSGFYAIDNLVTVEITMPDTDWQKMRTAEPRGGRCNFGFIGDRYDWFKATSVKISGSKSPQSGTFSQVQIIKKSYCGSFSTVKPALRLQFPKDATKNEDLAENLFGTRSITLNNSVQDSSYIRQPLGYEILRQAGLPHARCNFAKVIVNGTSLGVYVNLEPFKKAFLQSNFSGNDKGNLYELEVGEDITPPIVAAGKISIESGPFTDEKDLTLAASQIANGGLVATTKIIDFDQFIRFMAMESLLKHWDGYTINTNNTYVYNDTKAVANPTVANIKLKFIICGIDQILQESRDFEIGSKSVLAGLVRDNISARTILYSAIRTYANSVFSSKNQDTVLKPFIDQMEGILQAAGISNAAADIVKVRRQLMLVRSGAFQLIGELPSDSVTFLNKTNGECFHASNTEFISGGPPNGPQEVYHYPPSGVPADHWNAMPADKWYKLKNTAYGTWLHCDQDVKAPSGHLKVYGTRNAQDEGNNFSVEATTVNPFHATGYFRLKNVATKQYVSFSETDLTPLAHHKEVIGTVNLADAAVLSVY